jgi:hypothetical protein
VGHGRRNQPVVPEDHGNRQRSPTCKTSGGLPIEFHGWRGAQHRPHTLNTTCTPSEGAWPPSGVEGWSGGWLSVLQGQRLPPAAAQDRQAE